SRDWSSDVCSSDLLDVHIADAAAVQHRHALAAQAELLTGLGAGRHRDLGATSVERRHLDAATQCRRDHRDRHAAIDVGAVALEDPMRRDRQENVEIARRPAAQTGLALAGEANAGAVFHPRGDVYGEAL